MRTYHDIDDTDGVPVSILDCGTSVTVVVPVETAEQLGRARIRHLRLVAEREAGAE